MAYQRKQTPIEKKSISSGLKKVASSADPKQKKVIRKLTKKPNLGTGPVTGAVTEGLAKKRTKTPITGNTATKKRTVSGNTATKKYYK